MDSISNKKEKTEQHKKEVVKKNSVQTYKLASIIEREMKDINLSNEMMRNKMVKKLQKKVFYEISKDGNIITKIPVIYSDAMEKGNKYIVKFEYPMTLNKTLPSISPKYKIVFSIFSIVGSDIMEKLKDNGVYHTSGKSLGDVTGKIILPSGDTFFVNPSIDSANEINGNRISIDLGAMYYKNLKIK